MAGILYLCATPIGNLEDMTPRAQRMLAEADIIAAEDTRHTLQLLNRFNIKGRLVRYDEHSKERQGAYLLDELLAGKNVALVSDAGFPGIADPGEQLARMAIDAGVQVVPVPGANAALCALIASGLPASPFFFGGFLPKSKKNRRQQLEDWRYLPATVILYEAPHRIEQVLQEVLEVWGDRQLAAARELTKLHETVRLMTLSEALSYYSDTSPKGEYVLVLEGISRQTLDQQKQDSWKEMDLEDHMQLYLDQNLSKKEAMKKVAADRGVSKRDIYQQLLDR